MRKVVGILAVAAGVSLFAVPAGAQNISPTCVGPDAGVNAPADFKVCGHLDAISGANVTAEMTTRTLVNVGLWVFECRSGLQPQTQRVGTVYARWWRLLSPQHGQSEQVIVQAPATAPRPDVAAAYAATCPAIGQDVGLNFLVAPPTEAGIWTLDIVVTTSDGAGRCIEWLGRRENILVSW